MSLLGHLHSVVPGSPGGDPPVGTTTHLLVYNHPANPVGAYGPGWTLVVCTDTEWHWSVALAAHGAGMHAETRVAKAVAVRVLRDRGIRVGSWSDGFVAAAPMYRAVPETDHDRHPVPGPQSCRPVLRDRTLGSA